ncbi:hypothetical protein Q7P37_005877 [Cladosporium fusiforme]
MPPPQGIPNPIEGPGDFTVTETVHNDTYPAIDPTKQDLSGRVVFISGASKGIGRAISASFAKAGASTIAIAARSNLDATETAIQQAAKDAGRPAPTVLKVKLEVTNVESVSNAAAEVEKAAGRLDVLVNNAGVIDMTTITDSDPETWWNVWEVNVKGPYLVARAFLPLMLKADDSLKQVITVASVGAHLTTPTLSAYQPSKLAVLRFTEFIHSEHGNQGVTAISIHPGNILTEMATEGEMPEELKFVFTETAELPADTVVWLAAQKREWLSGRYVNVTWDMPQLEAKRKAIVDGDRLRVKLDVGF